MGFRANARVRLSGVVLLSAMVAACGGGGDAALPASPDAPAPPPIAPPPAAQLLDWQVHPAASVVLGQETLDDGFAGDIGFPEGSPAIAADGKLYVVTEGLVKAFDNYAAGGSTSQHTIVFSEGATNVSARGNRVVVVRGDSIHIYNNGPIGAENSDVYSSGSNGCDPDSMNMPQAAYLSPAGHLIAADWGNHRVLIWNPEHVPETGPLPQPDVVVGQRDMDSCGPNDATGEGGPTGSTLDGPRSVWSDGNRLVVVDQGNNRVLIWDQIPTGDFQPANHVLGQADPIANLPNRGGEPSEFTLSNPHSVDVNEHGQMAVADASNNRVLVWDSVPRASSVAANHVIGQFNFALSAENDSDHNGQADNPSARTLNFPTGAIFHNRNLLVVDHVNSRVLVFPASN